MWQKHLREGSLYLVCGVFLGGSLVIDGQYRAVRGERYLGQRGSDGDQTVQVSMRASFA
jgi:hypothetical protein